MTSKIFAIFLIFLSFSVFTHAQEEDLIFETYTITEQAMLVIEDEQGNYLIRAFIPAGETELYVDADNAIELDYSYYVRVVWDNLEGYLSVGAIDGFLLEGLPKRLQSGHQIRAFSGSVNVRALPDAGATQVGTIGSDEGLYALHQDAIEQLSELFDDLVFYVHADYHLLVILNGETLDTSSTVWLPVLLNDSVTDVDALEADDIAFVALRFNDTTLSVIGTEESRQRLQLMIAPQYIGLSGGDWNITYRTPEGSRTLLVNSESVLNIGAENSPLPLGVYSIDQIDQLGTTPQLIDELNLYIEYYSGDRITFDTTQLVLGILLEYNPRGFSLVRTIDDNGGEVDVVIMFGTPYLTGIDNQGNMPLSIFESGSFRDPDLINETIVDTTRTMPYFVRRGDFVLFLATVATSRVPGSPSVPGLTPTEFSNYLTTEVLDGLPSTNPFPGVPNSGGSMLLIVNAVSNRQSSR